MEWLFGKKMTPDEMLRKVKTSKISFAKFTIFSFVVVSN
jgi:hypothetical protein